MMKIFVASLAIAAILVTGTPVFVTQAQADGYCPSRPGGKCPTKKRKISKKSSDFSDSQREKLMNQARSICKKKYGAGATVYRFDYRTWTVVCKPS